jgi:hypothetical protein
MEALGTWKDFTWPSPGANYVNMRAVKGVVDEVAPMPVMKEEPVKVGKVSRL